MKRITACLLLLLGLTLAACGPRLSVEEASALLLEATKNNDLAGVTKALKQGAEVDTTEPVEALTPLIIASMNGYTDIAAHLMDAGANVDARSKLGITPLMGAAMNGHAELVTLLAAKTTNLDQLSEMRYKQNALHQAATNGHTGAVDALLKAGADVNALEASHSTALMYAAYYGHLEIVELLIEHGAELNIRDDGEHTALYWASFRNNTDIAALIAEAGGTE